MNTDDDRSARTLQRGLQALNSGDFKQAYNAASSVLARDADSAAAYFLLALTARGLNRASDAIRAFGKVTELEPRNADAWAHVAELFASAGEYDKAQTALREAVAHCDDRPIVMHTIAQALLHLGDHRQAGKWLEKALASRPEDAGILVNLAICRMYLGDLERSREYLQTALRLSPEDAHAHWLLSGLSKTDTDSHIHEMQKLLAGASLPPRSAAYLHYACGKEFEDLQRWNHAFDAFARGAAAMRSLVQFDEQAEITQYQSFIDACTREWMNDGTVGFEDASPIFIVGQPRSGTTLVERILSAHSQVLSAGELKHFPRCCAKLAQESGSAGRSFAELIRQIDARRLGEAYIDACRPYRDGSEHFIDKYPPNFMHLPLILKALPKARVIHLSRGAMDNCFSMFKQLFAGAYSYSYDLRTTARHYVRYREMMNIWRERFGDRYFEVQYERVARDIDHEARRLVRFLGIDWEEACLRFHEQDLAVATASVVQVRSPVHTKSIGRWRKYETQLAPVADELDKGKVPLEFVDRD